MRVKIVILSYWIIIYDLGGFAYPLACVVQLICLRCVWHWRRVTVRWDPLRVILVVFFLFILRRLRLSCLVHPFNGLWLFVICSDVAFMYIFTVPHGCNWCYCLRWYYLISWLRFPGFSLAPPGKCQDSISSTSWPFPSKSFPNNHSSTVLQSDAIYSRNWKAVVK
jgi:hypothetical protein